VHVTVRPTRGDVEEYNDLTSRSNEVVDQYNAKLEALEAQIRATVPGATRAV
jgi:hypothetical protein